MPCTAEFSTFYASCRAFHAPHGVIQRRHSFARSGLARVDGSFVHFPARNWKATQPSQTVARHFEPYSVCSQTLNASVKIWKFAARCFYHIVIVCLHWSENCQHFLNCVYLSVDYRKYRATNTKNNNRNINKAIQTVRAESCNILGAQKHINLYKQITQWNQMVCCRVLDYSLTDIRLPIEIYLFVLLFYTQTTHLCSL